VVVIVVVVVYLNLPFCPLRGHKYKVDNKRVFWESWVWGFCFFLKKDEGKDGKVTTTIVQKPRDFKSHKAKGPFVPFFIEVFAHDRSRTAGGVVYC